MPMIVTEKGLPNSRVCDQTKGIELMNLPGKRSLFQPSKVTTAQPMEEAVTDVILVVTRRGSIVRELRARV